MTLLAFFIYITFTIFVATSHKDPYFYSPLNLYISDDNYTFAFSQVAKTKSMIGILFTNKFCKDCYSNQGEFVKIIEYVRRKHQISIYRSQISSNEGLQEQFGIKRFPLLHFVLPYRNSFLLYQNYGLVVLEEIEETVLRLKNIFRTNQLPENQKREELYINKQSLIFLDADELLEHYSLNQVFQNLPNLAFPSSKQFKKTLSIDQIPQSEIASCTIYWRSNKKCFSPTTPEEVSYIFSILNFEKITEFTQQTYKAYQELTLDRYIFIAVLDSIFNRGQSYDHLKMLNKLLQRRQFRGRITIFWMETQINTQKLKHLGFKQTDHPPLFSLFDLSGAPKKILLDKYGKPAFSEAQIIQFIKNILKVDQSRELLRWNQELLQQSLERLILRKHYKLVSLKDLKEIKSSSYFVLSFPIVQYQLLGDSQIFNPMILNYRYLIERINRFSQQSIEESYLTFEKYSCKETPQHGLFYIVSNSCFCLSSQILFDQKQVSESVHQHFHLPKHFWINEDNLQEYLTQNSNEIGQDDFEYAFI